MGFVDQVPMSLLGTWQLAKDFYYISSVHLKGPVTFLLLLSLSLMLLRFLSLRHKVAAPQKGYQS